MLRYVGAYAEWNNIDMDYKSPRCGGLENDVRVPLYPANTKQTKFSFVSNLLHLKSFHRYS